MQLQKKNLLFLLSLALFLLTPQKNYSQLSADFSVDNQTGCLSVISSFTDLSAGNPTVWNWTFYYNGMVTDVRTSSNPGKIFTQPGCHDVKLVVTNAAGLKDSIRRNCFIEVFRNPTADFGVDTTLGCAPADFQLTNQTIANAAGGLAGCTWVFINQSTLASVSSSLPNPLVTLVDIGIYDVQLQCTNTNGCDTTIRRNGFLQVVPTPIANFGIADTIGCTLPLPVSFTNNSQTNGALGVNYGWLFPTGTPTNFIGANPQAIAINNAGPFSATLVAVSAFGCADSFTRTSQVILRPITAIATVSDTTPCLNQIVSFNDITLFASRRIWDYGDGSPLDTTLVSNTAHAFGSVGVFTISLIVESGIGCLDTFYRNIEVLPLPLANFSVSPAFNCDINTVFTFTDLSPNNPGIWGWQFGDGNTSSAQNATHVYGTAGLYNVCLTIRDTNNCRNVLCDTNAVSIVTPNAAFAADNTLGCAPYTSNFTDNSTSNDTIVAWEWTFDDGSGTNVAPGTSILQNPSTTVLNAGIYNVTLIITTQNGCKDTTTITNYLRAGSIPLVDFTVDEDSLCVDEIVNFTSSSVSPVYQYNWDFNFPSSFTPGGSMMAFAYPDTGCYDVGLEIEHNGCRDSIVKRKVLCVFPPVANFSLNSLRICSTPSTISIIDLSTGPITNYRWYFNNALVSTLPTPPPIPIPNGFPIGSYDIKLVVLNSNTGCIDSIENTVVVGAAQADFRISNSTICQGDTVRFIDLSPTGASRTFGFGNGASISGPSGTNAQYIYPDTGLFSILLIVRDNFSGCADTLEKVDSVRVNGAYAWFDGVGLIGCPGLTSQFMDMSNSSQNTPIVSWRWDFGDTVNNTAITPNTIHTYNDPGTYPVKLVVQDANGCIDSLLKPSYVNVSQPNLSFTTTLDSTCLGNTVGFNNLSTGINLTYKWIFGPNPGDTSNVANPGWVFQDTGFHDITLIGIDSRGCVDTLVVANAIYIEQLQLDFLADRTSGTCPPFNVNFTNLTTGKVDSVIWSFGDGTRSFQNNPSHIYSYPGSYDVTLIAFHRDGCVDTLIKSSYINIAGPTGSLSFNPSPVCFGDTVYFAVDIDSAAAVFLDLDDGLLINLLGQNTTGTVNFTHVYSDSGYFDPVVVVQDAGGCRVTLAADSSVRVLALPRARISPSSFSGCVPFGVTLLDNSIPGDTMLTSWTWIISTNDTLIAQDTSYTFNQVGFYDITLQVEDAYGCKGEITRQFETTPLPIADFIASDSFTCSPVALDFTDRSHKTFIVDWLWTFGNGDTIQGTQNPRVSYLQDGTYDVQLIVFDSNGCSDTLTKPQYINLRHPQAKWHANALTGCAPDELTFYADSSQVLTDTTLARYTWQLDLPGGLQTNATGLVGSTADSVVQAYNAPGVFGVRLVVEDIFGCTDTLVDSVQIFIPPDAAFGVSDQDGCISFTTTFLDQSTRGDTNLVGWLYDFQTGDSAFLDTSVYTFVNPGIYDVDLFVVDANGCIDSASLSVEAFDLPVVNFMASDTFNCSPIDITFTDQSSNTPVTGWQWNFGDGMTAAGSASAMHRYTTDGMFDVQLIATDNNGCMDSLTKTAYVHLRHPEAYIYATDPGGCNPVTITLFGDSSQVLSDTLITNYIWILETDLGVQPPVMTTVDTFDQTYPVFGDYDVSLIVVDVFGCRDTVTRPDYIQIEETTEPNPINLEYVTVADKESVELVWEQFPGIQRNFSQYYVHWLNPTSGQFTIVDSISPIGTTTYIHNRNLNTEFEPYTYKIQAQNSCKQNSNLNNTTEHTTVHLMATPDIDAIQLDWTAYAGWTPSLYQIYEVNSYRVNNLTLVATVPGSQTAFVDTNTFCSDFKSYRITALRGSGNNIRSFSNLDSIRPIHLKPTEVIDVTYASVRADSVIELAWSPYSGYKPEMFILQKSRDGENWTFLDSLPIDTFYLEDTDVLVDELSYSYRLRAVDACKDLSPFGFYGRNIVLDVDLQGKYPTLKWSAYEQWGNGVLAYDIEVFNDDLATWQFVASTNSNTLSFADDFTELNQGIYCYRIRAREANGYKSSALSNEDCVIFSPYVFTPNAFTPNGDDINDRFIVQAPTLRVASILIFNRWGTKIYESSNLQEGWDGRFKGEAVPEGVYVFVIQGQGEDGTPIELKGTVTLIR